MSRDLRDEPMALYEQAMVPEHHTAKPAWRWLAINGYGRVMQTGSWFEEHQRERALREFVQEMRKHGARNFLVVPADDDQLFPNNPLKYILEYYAPGPWFSKLLTYLHENCIEWQKSYDAAGEDGRLHSYCEGKLHAFQQLQRWLADRPLDNE